MADGFGIIKDDVPEREHPVPFDLDMATKLYNCLRANKLLFKSRISPSPTKWSIDFRWLRKSFTEEEITTAVDWYVKHIRDEFTPRFYSARKFREGFGRVQEAMRRAAADTEIADAVISPSAKKMAQGLNLEWPGPEKKLELVFLQVSYDRYAAVVLAMQKLVVEAREEAWDKYDKHRRFISSDWTWHKLVRFVYEAMPTPIDYVQAYAQRINGVAWTWSKWRGNLIDWSFNPGTDDHFQMMMSKTVAEYTGSGDRWEEIWAKTKAKM